jgi:hypothetical protein
VCAFIKAFGLFAKLSYFSNWRLSLSNQGSGFQQNLWFVEVGIFSGGNFQIWRFQKLAFVFFSLAFIFNLLRSLKLASKFSV